MRNVIILLTVIIGILSWNSSKFVDETSFYQIFCGIIFIADVIFFIIFLFIYEEE